MVDSSWGEGPGDDSRTLGRALLAAGIDTVFTCPGWQVDALLPHLMATNGLRLVISTSESAAAAASHGFWLSTGRAAGLLVMGAVGIEAALPMLRLAAREFAGCLVIIPRELPEHDSCIPVLSSCGFDVHSGLGSVDVARVAAASAGRVVAVVGLDSPAAVHAASPLEPVATADNCAEHSRDHPPTVAIVGPLASRQAIARVVRHRWPVITLPGVQVPTSLVGQWCGMVGSGMSAAVTDILGLREPDEPGGTVVLVGCPGRTAEYLRYVGVTAPVRTEVGRCGCRSRLAPSAVRPSPLVLTRLSTVLLLLARSLHRPILAGDAGGSHRVVAHLAQRSTDMSSALVTYSATTMGWATGAALGAGAATGRPVIVSLGDGSLPLVGLQLTDLVRAGIAGVVVVSRNGILGSVETRLRAAGATTAVRSQLNPAPIDLSLLGGALGLPARTVDAGDTELIEAVKWATGVASGGALALMGIDTTGESLAEQALPSGMAWVDALTRPG